MQLPAALLPHSVAVRRYEGTGPYGEVFGDPVTHRAFVEDRRRLVVAPDPRGALDLIDAVFVLLHGASHLALSGVVVHLAERTGSTPMGRDANGRYEHADTYRLTSHRPTRHRI